MRTTSTSLAFLALVTIAASGCTAPQDDDPNTAKETTEDPLTGGVSGYLYPTFAKETGMLLIRGGCTATRVGPRHILTAAHCVMDTKTRDIESTYSRGKFLSITQNVDDQNAAAWSTISVGRVWVHPTYDAAFRLGCSWSLTCTRDFGASDVAVIETMNDMPSTISSARVGTSRYEAAGYQRRVFIAGYGCQGGIVLPPAVGWDAKARSIGFAVTPIEPISSINNYGPVLSNAQFWPFGGSYLLTAGASHPNGQASLCPGDSGGPVLLSRSVYPGGPAYHTNVVIGVNADYTFGDVKTDPPLLSTFNIHTRLSNDAPSYVGGWLQTILPYSSFLWTMDP